MFIKNCKRYIMIKMQTYKIGGLSMKKVLIIGGTSFDSMIYLKELPTNQAQTIFTNAPLHETIGSTGARKALNLIKLGVDTTLHSVIGEDDYGNKITTLLKQAKVPFVYDIDPLGTKRYVNLIDEAGQQISIFAVPGSEQPVLDFVRLEQLISKCDLVVLNIISYTKQLIHLIQKYNKPIWLDLKDYKINDPYYDVYIQAADVIFCSSTHLPKYKQMMRKWMKQGKELIVCTHGKDKVTLLTKEDKWSQISIVDNYPYKSINEVGDSFFSGFLYAYLNNKSYDECLSYGMIVTRFCMNEEELVQESVEIEYQKYEMTTKENIRNNEKSIYLTPNNPKQLQLF